MLQLFSYESNNVRVVMIDDEPWFVLSDVLKAINSTTTVTAAKNAIAEGLGEEFVRNQPLETEGGNQDLIIIGESGVTFIAARSKTDLGKRLNRWIHSEVLPSIRKTGGYGNQLSQLEKFIAEQTIINRKLLEDSKQLTLFHRKGVTNPGCFNILNSDNDSTEQAVTAQQYLVSKGMGSWTKRHTFSKRAASALRVGKHLESLPMYKNNVLYYGEDVAYLEETLAQMLDLN